MVKIPKIYTFFPKLSNNNAMSNPPAEQISSPETPDVEQNSFSVNIDDIGLASTTQSETNAKKRVYSDDSQSDDIPKRPNLNLTGESVQSSLTNSDVSISDQAAAVFEENTPHWVELLFKSFDALKFEIKSDIGTLNDKFDKFSQDTSIRLEALERDSSSLKDNQNKLAEEIKAIETESVNLKTNIESLSHKSNKLIEKDLIHEKEVAALKQKNLDFEKGIEFLSNMCDDFKRDLSDLATNNCTILTSISTLSKKVDQNEQHSRNECLLLHGVPEHQGTKESPDQSKELFCKNITNHLGFGMQPSYIKRAHRLGQRRSNGKPRPIIVRFYDPDLRNIIFSKKKECKNKGISITESLTRTRMQKKGEAENKYGSENVWTREGRIYGKVEGAIKELYA